jgi:hypothetical protein
MSGMPFCTPIATHTNTHLPSLLTQRAPLSNNIGDEGARTLAAALDRNATLTQVDLASAYIGDVGARALAAALANNATLAFLNLYRNKIGAR